IEPENVLRVFDDERIRALAAELPAGANLNRLADGIREAARIYAREAREASNNKLHSEIAELHRAAERRRYDQVAKLIDGLSGRARALLSRREGPALPRSEALADRERRDEVCATVARLCRFGGSWVEGRKRPSGKRSHS